MQEVHVRIKEEISLRLLRIITWHLRKIRRDPLHQGEAEELFLEI
jgi:hypothetical protein